MHAFMKPLRSETVAHAKSLPGSWCALGFFSQRNKNKLLFFCEQTFIQQINRYQLTNKQTEVTAENKVPSGENTELKRSPFKAGSRRKYSQTCYAYCRGFLPCLFLPFRSIHLHFFQNLSRFFLCWLWLTHGSCVGLQNKIGHPAGGRFPC